MRINTFDLIGPALDWAVADAAGEWVCWRMGRVEDGVNEPFSPSTDWAQGGPIIERERIAVEHAGDCWLATVAGVDYHADGMPDDFPFGPTPLIAAMRCYVWSKLGGTVDIPPECLTA